ncbi:MAG TPA: glucuronate isomerase [Gemmataceae bacterium]|jgi:glucuronate isomerase|nr:glucuronate isomerase [Gemmataceae bacterium]
MLNDRLAEYLYTEICHIPLIDPHSHIDPHRPTARTLDDILGYHYYTELAHSVGMDKALIGPKVGPRDRVRAILYQMAQFDNTAQYTWFLEIARAFLNFQGDRVTLGDANWLCETAERVMARPDYEQWVLHRSNIEKVFLTNDFDDPLEGFDTQRYVPCLRTDDLVFHLDKPEVRQRLAKATNVEVGDAAGLRLALTRLFEHFTRHGAKACAISLPPDFTPQAVPDNQLSSILAPRPDRPAQEQAQRAVGIFWLLAEHCRVFKLPFDLMIGVNRRVYRDGVYQGQDLFDQRTSLIQYAELFNAFPDVTFCVSVLSSVQNQELASFSWIFPNVITSGHWWYSNIPAFIQQDCRARLQAVPKTKQIGYYSDMYKLEFGLPKYNMYRRILAQILADDFVRPRVYTESQALTMARLLLHDNVRRLFNV